MEPHANLEYENININEPKIFSHWLDGKLNKHLIAQIGTLKDGKPHHRIECLLEDAEFSLENQYSTPFENSNPEGRMPSLMGMIQSGMVTPTISTLVGTVDNLVPDIVVEATNATIQQASKLLDKPLDQMAYDKLGEWEANIDGLAGKTSFTKINSQMVYTSSSATRITATIVLVAWQDAKVDVEDKLQALQQLATPAKLHEKTVLQSFATEDSKSKLHALFPSQIPAEVFLTYGGKTYSPLFIENLSAPITAPMNKDGDRIAIKAQITFVSKTAWDSEDIFNLYWGE